MYRRERASVDERSAQSSGRAVDFDARAVRTTPSGARPAQARRPQLEEHGLAAVEAGAVDERDADRWAAGAARSMAASAAVRSCAACCARPCEAPGSAAVAIADRTRAGATPAAHASGAALTASSAHAAAARAERGSVCAHEHSADYERCRGRAASTTATAGSAASAGSARAAGTPGESGRAAVDQLGARARRERRPAPAPATTAAAATSAAGDAIGAARDVVAADGERAEFGRCASI